MTYDIDYFINKFEAIPEEKWTKGMFENNGKHCANGHCGVNGDNYNMPPAEALALAEILHPLRNKSWVSFGEYIPIFSVTVNINDGFAPEYQQPTPKQRILAALYDIRDMEKKDTGKATEQPKVKTVYVSVPVSITEPAKELIEN